jgi:hypothetical protein
MRRKVLADCYFRNEAVMPHRRPSMFLPRSELTELAASSFVQRHGRSGLHILEERAELAELLGHKIAAETWRKMADTAASLLRTERSSSCLPKPPPSDLGKRARNRH